MWKKYSSLGGWKLNLSFSLRFSCNLDLDQNSTLSSGHQLSVSPGIDLPRSSSVRSSLGCLQVKFAAARPKLEHGDLCWVWHDLVCLQLTPLTHTHFLPFSSCFHSRGIIFQFPEKLLLSQIVFNSKVANFFPNTFYSSHRYRKVERIRKSDHPYKLHRIKRLLMFCRYYILNSKYSRLCFLKTKSFVFITTTPSHPTKLSIFPQNHLISTLYSNCSQMFHSNNFYAQKQKPESESHILNLILFQNIVLIQQTFSAFLYCGCCCFLKLTCLKVLRQLT